jgi:hypothetical protein
MVEVIHPSILLSLPSFYEHISKDSHSTRVRVGALPCDHQDKVGVLRGCKYYISDQYLDHIT